MVVNPVLRNSIMMTVSLGSCMENPCRVWKWGRHMFELKNMTMDGKPHGTFVIRAWPHEIVHWTLLLKSIPVILFVSSRRERYFSWKLGTIPGMGNKTLLPGWSLEDIEGIEEAIIINNFPWNSPWRFILWIQSSITS